jgi:hypothetical protein
MTIPKTDKLLIEHWVKLYNRLTRSTYRIADWPDKDSSKKNVDATCVDDAGLSLAIEHTLVQPFENEKADAARFLQTLSTLENDPALVQAGYMYLVSQRVGSIPNGVNWSDVPKEMRTQLTSILPGLSEGLNKVLIRAAGWVVELKVDKLKMSLNYPGKFLTARRWPGDPAPDLILSSLKNKVPKLSVAAGDKKILLLEKDAVAGTIESQFEQVKDSDEVRQLLRGIDEIWTTNTAGLQKENVIFSNKIWPEQDRSTICSLDISTARFWQVEQ